MENQNHKNFIITTLPEGSESNSTSTTPNLSSDHIESKAQVVVNTSEERPGFELPTWRFAVVVICICTGLYLSLMDITVAASALFTISEDFENFRQSNWVVLSYSSAYVGFATVFTRLSEVFNRKTAVICSFAVFITFSLACGWAQSSSQLIIFRSFQGAGGSGLYTLAMTVLPEMCPLKLLPALSGIIGAVVAVAGISGPIFGGLLASYSSWRWCFWMNAPIGIIPMLLLYFVWPTDNVTAKAVSRPKARHLDYFGASLMVLGSVPLVVGLQQAGSRAWAWNSAISISLLTIAVCSWIAFFSWQWTISTHSSLQKIHGQLPFALLKNRVMFSTILGALLTGYIYTSTIVNIPIRGQIVNILSAVQASVRLIPLLASSAIGSFVAGAASYQNNNTFWSLNIACCFMMLGSGLMSTLEITVYTQAKQYGYEVLLGFGIGLTLATTTIIAGLNTQFTHHAVSQGIISQIRVLGGTIGVSMSTIILNAKIERDLTGKVTPSQLKDFFSSPVAGYQWTLQQQAYVRKSETETFNLEMRICTYIASACLVISLFTWQRVPPTMLERKRQQAALYKKEAPSGESAV